MKKNSIFICMAVLPLLVVACAKNTLLENEEPSERATMIDPWTAIDQTPYMKMQKGEGVPLVAVAEQTKSSMTVDEGHSVATVSWSAGDSINMYGYNSGYEGATYTTTAGGDKAAFTTPHVLPPSPQHCLFVPASVSDFSKLSPGYDGDCFFGIKIPVEQKAVAGKVKDKYLYSYARTTLTGSGKNLDETHNATFHSMLAYVRFKMSGSIVPSVQSVTLRGSSAIAGDCVVIPTSVGTTQISFSKSFTGDAPSNTVTITPDAGSFAADTYYYFAVAPGTQISFSLVFSDGSSHTTTKISSNSVTFARGQITDIGTINLGSSFSDPTTPSTETITYMTATTTSPTKPVTIAVIPDGFTEGELFKYELLAKSAINTLFNVEPFKSYKEYFNVYILKVASNESGANITDGSGNITTARDCYFGSKWGASSYNDMTANETTVNTFVSANCPDIVNSIHTINEVPVLMIINDSRYGGICHSSSSGSGYGMVPYTYNGGRMTWAYGNYEAKSDSDPAQGYQETPLERYAEIGSNEGNWLNTMVHEFGGHCFGRLADEYWNGTTSKDAVTFISGHRWDNPLYYGVPFALNVSATYNNPGYDDPGLDAQYIKQGWQHLLDKKATLVASNPLYNRIGVYQGGEVSLLNRWRSERISCMIDNRFYFSTFQRELIVKRIMSLAGVAFNESTFWAKDDPTDPVRDIASSPVMGETDPVAPRPVPLLPPPVFHTDW